MCLKTIQQEREDMMTSQQEHKERILKDIDPKMVTIVRILIDGGVETFESCQGGRGHAFPEPTVRFYGAQYEGFRALSVALCHGLRVTNLRRVWSILDNEPVGPEWEMTFVLGGKK